MAKIQFVLAFAFIVIAGCTSAKVGDYACVPGSVTDGTDCAPACPMGSTHSVCNDSGSGSRCVTRPGQTCDLTPPAPCGGAPVGDACDVCGVSGITACVGDSVRCIAEHAAVEICDDGIDNNCNGAVDEGCTASCTPSVEICDGLDNNCNGAVDEGCDDDNDGYCDSGMAVGPSGTPTCPHTPSGGVGNDCNDNNLGIHPGAAETCGDGVDSNCDGSDPVCSPPVCTPTNGGVETCDGIDNDCSGAVDEGCDDDNDGYCDSGMAVGPSGTPTCPHTPSGGVGNDCNDNNLGIHPGAAETCGDGVDSNCDGSDPVCSPPVCTPTNGGVETCDGIDNDCNGWVDDGGVCATACSENLGGTLTVHPSTSLRASCSRGLVIIAWGPGGTEFRSTAGATSFSVPMSSGWRGYVFLQAFCPNPGVDGTVVGEWHGGVTDWSSSAGRTLRAIGLIADIDGRDVSDAGLICRDTGSGGYKPVTPLDECSAFTCPS